MRAEELQTLEHYQRQIALRISRLSEPETFSQEIDAIATVAAASAAYCKISEAKARLFGLHAVVPKTPDIHNVLQLNGTNQQSVLQDLLRLQEIQNGK